MTSKSTIQGWLETSKKEGATHMLVVCDTFDWDDYPVSVDSTQDVRKVYEKYNGPNMQKVMEVYNLSLSIEDQMNEYRAFHF